MKWQALVLILSEGWRKMGRGCGFLPRVPARLVSQLSKSQVTPALRALLALLVPSPFCLDTSTTGRWIEWPPTPRL